MSTSHRWAKNSCNLLSSQGITQFPCLKVVLLGKTYIRTVVAFLANQLAVS